jgi:very-short-patch-repair endonuclease
MPHHHVPEANRRLGKMMRGRMTPAEFRLWVALRNRRLMDLRFRRQVPLGPYILDFFCPEAKLAVEVDGGQHGLHRVALADTERDSWLAAHGICVLRFSNAEVRTNLGGVCDAILAAVPRIIAEERR